MRALTKYTERVARLRGRSTCYCSSRKRTPENKRFSGVWRAKIACAGTNANTARCPCTGSHLLSSGLYRRRRILTELLPCGSRASQSGWITVDRELGSPPHPAPKVTICGCGFTIANVTQWVKSGGLEIGDWAIAAQSPISNPSFASSSSFTDRRWGKRITSRMVSRSVKSITSRSMPIPKPPVGGIP